MIQKPQYDSTDRLCQVIYEKQQLQKQLKKAVNDYVTAKQDLLHKSNAWKLNPDAIKEELGLSKNPTEKQVQAFIDEKMPQLTDAVTFAKENVNLIKRDIELKDDEISLWKYKCQFELKEEQNE